MTATLYLNSTLNGIEINFNSKPATEILTTLKSAGFRWHSVKKLWYAKNTPERLAIAEKISNKKEETTEIKTGGTTSNGYLGAIRWDGCNSHLNLSMVEINKLIKKEMQKRYKGVKFSATSGGNCYCTEATFTIKINRSAAFVDFETYKKVGAVAILRGYWFNYTDENGEIKSIHINDIDWNNAELINNLVSTKYKTETGASYISVNQYHINAYNEFTPELKEMLNTVNSLYASFNYDDSNSQVDYFDRGFYEELKVVILD